VSGLSVYVLRITATAIEPIELDEYAGSALRGALFQALLRRFCMNPVAATCTECELNPTCPVAGLVAPLRDERARGRDIPRPFVLSYASIHKSTACTEMNSPQAPITVGQSLSFDVSLVGRAIAFLPYIALSVPILESIGIGRPLHTNGGRRGRFRLERIELVDPFGDETQVLYRRGETTVAAPTLAVTPERVRTRAATLPSDRFALHFLTPTRLIAGGQLMHQPELWVVVARLAERLDALTREYGGTAEAATTLDFEEARQRARAVVAHAEKVKLAVNETKWVDVASYSARQQRTTPIGGLVGRALYEGDLEPLRELLVWGELLHVGKNAVKGDGLYRIEA